MEETQKSQESAWNKEKSRLEDKLRERERLVTNSMQLEEMQEKVNRLAKENESLRSQLEDIRRIVSYIN